MLVDFFCKTIHEEYSFFATWTPNTEMRLGDIGRMNGFLFDRVGSLSDMGIDFEIRESPFSANTNFMSDKNIKVTTQLAGEISEPIPGLTKGDTGFHIQFKSEQAVIVKLEGAKIYEIEDQLSLEQEILQRFKISKHEKEQWKKNYVVVTKLVKVKAGTVIVSKGRNNSLSVRANNTLRTGEVDIINVKANFEVISGGFQGEACIATEGMTPFFMLKQLKRQYLFGKFELRERGGKKEENYRLAELPFPSVNWNIDKPKLALGVKRTDFKIRVLSIGINKYQHLDVTKHLEGCIKDVSNLRTYLQNKLAISDDDYLTLTNAKAERNNIIASFRSHFADLEDGDIALFHFSGHGSWEETTKDFVDQGLEPPKGRNEIILCYDTNAPHVYGLADKELRWLIAEIQQDKDVLFVGLFDCCYSGSMLRDRESKKGYNIRICNSRPAMPRPIDQYLEGVYLDKDSVELPNVNYISLTACSANQLAAEDSGGGLFTQALIRSLDSTAYANYFPTYSELFYILRESVKNNASNNQTPYFEYSGKVNPKEAFLKHGEEEGGAFSELIWNKEDQKWKITQGAIHGITADSIKSYKIPVYTRDEKKMFLGYVNSNTVEFEYITVKWKEEIKLRPEEKSEYFRLPTKREMESLKEYEYPRFLVSLVGNRLPIKLSYKVDRGAKTVEKRFRKELEKIKNKVLFTLSYDAFYHVKIESEIIRITYYDIVNVVEIFEVQFHTYNQIEQAVLEVVGILIKIARWEQLNSLSVSKLRNDYFNNQAFSFQYKDYFGNYNIFKVAGANHYDKMSFASNELFDNSQVINDDKPVVELEFDDNKGGFEIAFFAEKDDKIPEIYYYLIHLGNDFNISQLYESYSKKIVTSAPVKLYPPSKRVADFRISTSDDKRSNIFILISSTEELTQPHIFEQYGILERKVDLRNKQTKPRNDNFRSNLSLKQTTANWTVRRIEIILNRSITS